MTSAPCTGPHRRPRPGSSAGPRLRHRGPAEHDHCIVERLIYETVTAATASDWRAVSEELTAEAPESAGNDLTIDRHQRDAIYAHVFSDLTIAVGETYVGLEHGEWAAARALRERVEQDMRLLDDIGWGKGLVRQHAAHPGHRPSRCGRARRVRAGWRARQRAGGCACRPTRSRCLREDRLARARAPARGVAAAKDRIEELCSRRAALDEAIPLEARRPCGTRPDEIEALLDAVPDLRPTLRTAPPDELVDVFEAFKVKVTFDKANRKVTLAATLTPERVPQNDKTPTAKGPVGEFVHSRGGI